MWVVREGYEGLVRGNQAQADKDEVLVNNEALQEVKTDFADAVLPEKDVNNNLLYNLRFGDGALLRDGTSEYVGGRTLKGRYIVRVGWDDVRGWFSEVSLIQRAVHEANLK
jgi:6-phosphofructokinase 1